MVPEPVRAVVPEPARAVVPEPVRAVVPEPGSLRAADPEPPSPAEPPAQVQWGAYPAESAYPAQRSSAAEPPSAPRPAVTSAFESGPAPGSIGWLWPEETASRGGGGGPRWQPPGRWRYRTATLVALGAVVLAGAGVAIGISLHSSPGAGAVTGQSSPKVTVPPTAKPAAPPTHAVGNPAPANAAGLASAAAWISLQVGSGTVACDVQTCAALTAHGFPAAQEDQLGTNSQAPPNPSVVVVTPNLSTIFNVLNPSLGHHVAPESLATFGQITIQVIYPDAADASPAAFSQDLQARAHLGEQLLNSGRVSASATAQNELAAGDVDSRVLLALQALAQQQPIHVVAFSDSGPGASPGVPLREVDLAETNPAAGMSSAAYLQSMIRLLRAHATFPAFTHVGQQRVDGRTVVQFLYAVPSPLGLLGPS